MESPRDEPGGQILWLVEGKHTLHLCSSLFKALAPAVGCQRQNGLDGTGCSTRSSIKPLCYSAFVRSVVTTQMSSWQWMVSNAIIRQVCHWTVWVNSVSCQPSVFCALLAVYGAKFALSFKIRLICIRQCQTSLRWGCSLSSWLICL